MGFHRLRSTADRLAGRRRKALAVGALLASVAGAALGSGALEPGGAATAAPGPHGPEFVTSADRASISPILHTSGAAARIAPALARRHTEIVIRGTRAAIAAAREAGGTPIALVEEPTPLMGAPGGRRVARLDRRTEFDSPRVLAVLGQERDWVEVMAPELANGETGWVRASALDVGRTVYSLRADLSERRIEVRRRGRLVRTLSVAIGGPATPTPTGEFAVTDKLYISDGTAAYGCCALALTGHQPDVPQGWSGGDRLAVHATPHTATIGQPASLGCFRTSEDAARWLVENVPIGSRIAITQ